MSQEIKNDAPVEKQVNIAKFKGSIIATSKTRWQKRFERLQEEVKNDIRYESFIVDFNTYNTLLDGIGLEQKLIDAGFSQREILKAMDYKDKYARRVVLGEMYLSQQEIDVEIFSIIDTNFEAYIIPLLTSGIDKSKIKTCLLEKVIQPILELINKEGEADEFLNYNANDIYGMVYFLTGKCHLNWKSYDTLQ